MATDSVILLSLPELYTALSYALDITEGQPRGHSVRCCWIGVHIGRKLSFKEEELGELYYTLLLKDSGCSSNAARLFQLYGTDELRIKKDYKHVDSHKFLQVLRFIIDHTSLDQGRLGQLKCISNIIRNGGKLATELIQTRCERGANIVKRLGFNQTVADGVMFLDEHYDGSGRPSGLAGKSIPVYSQIALLSQVADVFCQIAGPLAAQKEVLSRSGTWFDPGLVQAFTQVSQEKKFWEALTSHNIQQAVVSIEPKLKTICVDDDYLDTVAQAFADIIDAKSPFTFNHSTRVAGYADILAEKMGVSVERRRWLYRGSLLRDIGKLGVSNAILDKPGKLTEEEFEQIKLHPKYTEEILSKISIFKDLAIMTGAHHERLDGKG